VKSRPSYRALFLTCFWWFRGWAHNDLNAAGAAGVLLVVCHFLNIVSFATLWHPGTGEIARLYEWASRYSLVYVACVMAYFWYFIRNIGKWVDPDDVEGRPGTAMNIVAAMYIILTIVSTIAAIVA
jgi:hypothetical protein